jgi:hypothetical protein
MRKFLLGLTTAAALGALALPNIASAANNHGSSGGGGGHSAGVASQSFNGGGARFSGNANVGGSRNLAVRSNSNVQNFAVRNNTRNFAVNNNAQRWNGQRWAGNDRRHHRHDRNFLFVPFAAYGDYAAYDQCWQSILTPAGYERVYVCGPDGYGYY